MTQLSPRSSGVWWTRPGRSAYLFGSRARGDAGPDSDYDLMLVMEDTAFA